MAPARRYPAGRAAKALSLKTANAVFEFEEGVFRQEPLGKVAVKATGEVDDESALVLLVSLHGIPRVENLPGTGRFTDPQAIDHHPHCPLGAPPGDLPRDAVRQLITAEPDQEQGE